MPAYYCFFSSSRFFLPEFAAWPAVCSAVAQVSARLAAAFVAVVDAPPVLPVSLEVGCDSAVARACLPPDDSVGQPVDLLLAQAGSSRAQGDSVERGPG
jgi:hypothetical protein